MKSVDNPYLGPCCACGKEADDVRNIILLHRKCPTPGRGWGCLQCGLPADYATAVVCDGCQESGAEIKFVCTGYPGSDGRTPIEMTQAVKVKHNYLHHPEALQTMTWFDDSPDYGHPECLCSICGEQIEQDGEDQDPSRFPLRLYRAPSEEHPHGQEARFCPDCAPLLLKYGRFV